MSTVTVDYYGVSGTGRTVTEAKRDAGEKIKRMVNRSPKIWAHNGHAVVFSPLADGWMIQFIHPDSAGRIMSSQSSGGTDEEEAIYNALKHLIDMSRNVGEYPIPAWFPGHVDTKRMVGEWKHADSWQLAYRAAQAAGEPDPHQWAGWHQHEYKIA